jgi:sortase A
MSSFSAHYDEDGNIILGASDDAVASTDDPTPAPSFPERADREAMLLFGAPIETYDGGSQRIAPVRNEWSKTRNLLSDVLKEGQREFDVTHDEFRSWYRVSFRSVAEFPVTLKQALGRLVSFLTHPFTFRVRYTAPVKPRSRTTLFVIDSIRFGGTFATIFVSLYVALNLGSFWNIAKAQLALSDDTERVGALAQLTHGNQEQANDGTIAIPHAMASDGNEEHALDAHLPLVGPPDNRLVIPKLGENIPIVIPPTTSLVSEDWKGFENDIQDSLRKGVVHYPGTARPGQAGNFFLTGHSSYYPWDPGKYKNVFARLHELVPGDTYSVYYGGDLHTYRVIKTFEVKPSDVSVLDQPTNKRIATLMTCTPIGTTLRRLIVQSEEVDPDTGKALKVGERAPTDLNPGKLPELPI